VPNPYIRDGRRRVSAILGTEANQKWSGKDGGKSSRSHQGFHVIHLALSPIAITQALTALRPTFLMRALVITNTLSIGFRAIFYAL
jgi:hypothetical protein